MKDYYGFLIGSQIFEGQSECQPGQAVPRCASVPSPSEA